MADVAAQPFINYGISEAQQGQEQASANLIGQQAQAAAMQNRIMAARLPFIMKMYEQMGAQSDVSGVDGQGEPGGPVAARVDKVASLGFDPEGITTRNQARYGVPEWTPQERQNTQMAAASGDPAAIQYYATQRQQRLDTLRQRSAWDSSNRYSAYAAAVNAPSPYSYLQKVDPQYTNWLDRQTDDQGTPLTDAAKETAAKGYARYQAADLHKFTGRKLDFKDGQAVDTENGLPVSGVPDLKMAPKDQAQFIKDAQTPSIEVQTGVPGQTKKITPWQAAGFQNVHDYLAAVQQNVAPSPAQINTLTAGKPLTTADLVTLRANIRAQAPAGGIARPTTQPAPDPTNPGAPVPVPSPKKSAKIPANQPAAAAAPPASGPQAATSSPPAASTPPAAPFQGNETLQGVDASQLPKYTGPVNPPNVGASTEQNLDIQAHNKEKYNQMGAANQQLQKNANERGLLDQAQAEINRLRANPRAVGPGSQVTTAWNEFWSYATGKTPDALTERKLFDKVLLQMGAVNVKQAFDNQSRIGQQEYMKLLTEGNPTGAMPLDAIQQLVNFSRYNNEFSTRVNNTKLDALNRGADPYSREFNNLEQGRAAYVQARMNPGATNKTQPDVTEEQHRALNHGDPFYWKGQLHHKGVD
jgi:hypothetical protein